MKKNKFLLPLISILLFVALIMSACAPKPAAEEVGTVAVGSKDFTEQFIVAEMYAQILEEAGFSVER